MRAAAKCPGMCTVRSRYAGGASGGAQSPGVAGSQARKSPRTAELFLPVFGATAFEEGSISGHLMGMLSYMRRHMFCGVVGVSFGLFCDGGLCDGSES